MPTASAVIVTLLVIAALALFLISRRLRKHTGLPRGRIIYTDTGAWQRNEQSLYSSTYRVIGKPDYLVRDGDDIIPVEVKSSPAPSVPREGHVMQLAVYCLLVEENMGRRPPYGLIRYADKSFDIEYTEELRDNMLNTLSRMRAEAELPDGPHRDHNNPRRCATCGVREHCDERLA